MVSGMSVAQILNSAMGSSLLSVSSPLESEMGSGRDQIICACGAVRVCGVPAQASKSWSKTGQVTKGLCHLEVRGDHLASAHGSPPSPALYFALVLLSFLILSPDGGSQD